MWGKVEILWNVQRERRKQDKRKRIPTGPLLHQNTGRFLAYWNEGDIQSAKFNTMFADYAHHDDDNTPAVRNKFNHWRRVHLVQRLWCLVCGEILHTPEIRCAGKLQSVESKQDIGTNQIIACREQPTWAFGQCPSPTPNPQDRQPQSEQVLTSR